MKELSTEQRLLLALVLSVVVITLTDLLFFHRYAPAGQGASAPSLPASRQAKSAPPPAATQPPASAPGKPAVAPAPLAPVAGTHEQTIVVESPLYRVVLSSRGAVVRRWQLLDYHDESKPPKMLDVVHPPKNPQSDEWPLSLLTADPSLQEKANGALYQVQPGATTLHAPVTVQFTWSDGHLAVTKQIRFTTDYVADLHTSVTLDGQPVVYAVAWRGGFGDASADDAAAHVQVFSSSDGKVETIAANKVGTSDRPEVPARVPGPLQFAGIEDQYFAAAFLPVDDEISAWDWRTERQPPGAQPGTTEPVAEVAVGPPESAPGPATLRLFVGPKSLTVLGAVNPQLRSLVDFGIMGFIAEPLYTYVLRNIHHYVPNWGWAIVILTIILNMLLFPLKLSSWRSMQKMQRVMPEMKAIQARYKKYPMKDPRRQKMNEEMMELYRREGVNPLGSCLPMFLQMPIWWALFEMLEASIELRHAPWIFWIRDLSARDPYYTLPLLMVVAGYFMQKMTPMTAPDPTQQKMMNLMPVVFGLMFFRLASGLNLYILTSYLIGIAQQWYLNRTAPLPSPAAGRKPKPA